ncbi:myosin D [Cardiosporidium cionae]|uniref:Myosin D n=1 Tax=Cardiosporidium cionae TaxID=476202 RepID=A0ABQ7JE38_9APIC|nr:myosin D [Cardiosporidium cionae]|eukprot:KAF8822282.1 myosin D [Cardiosporidium cionae]
MATDKNEELKAASQLKRRVSEVYAIDKQGNVLKGFQIWCDIAPSAIAEPDRMFAKCVVQPGSTAENLKCIQIEPPGFETEVIEVSKKHAWNCNSQIDPMTYGDIGMLPHTNVACVLDFLRHRYLRNQIYTTADPLVVTINPFKDLGNTTVEWISRYRDAIDHTKLPPHVFYTSRTALDNLHAVKKSQTIIVSGESGAGKTEATKQMMRYFAAAKSGSMDLRIQGAIMAANPVLEAFGNAKTIRNNNSSRFGRFMQLDVAKDGGIQYGSVIAFLLEKSRILTQDDNERSYHIFYQLLKGASPSMREKYNLKAITDYKFINPKCLNVVGIDDEQEFADVSASFKSMSLTDEEIDSIWSIVSGVLLLGNVSVSTKEMAGIHDAAYITETELETFRKACKLLFLDDVAILHELTVKTTQAGSNKVEGVWKKEECEILKASLAKAMYEKLFLWIIRNLNKSIQPPNGFSAFIGMLDIFGFEVFKNNSLEQFFINITNEMLQKNFVDIVFERETKLYRNEGVSTAELEFTSNKDIIEALTAKGISVLSLLEEQCLAPGGTDEKFVNSCKNSLKGKAAFQPAKVGANINFLVVHTIGSIQYNADSFLFKNKDILRPEIMEIVQNSSNTIACQLFEGIVMEKGKMAKGLLIGSQFLNQLQALMEIINSTEPHFVRCVKPNDTKKALDWVSSKVVIQLHALSILEALQLRQLGYSYRRPFNEFLFQFKFINLEVSENTNLDSAAACKQLFSCTNLAQTDYAIGKTMVFLKQQAAKDMTQLQREALAAWEPLVSVLESFYLKLRFKRKLESNMHSIIRIQAHIRR